MRRFTNRQVTTMVVAVCVTILLAPMGVMAATGQLVNIADGNQKSDLARVDDGKLRVGDGGGALSVDGTVGTRPSLPAKGFQWDGGIAPPFSDFVLVEKHGAPKLVLTSAIATSGSSSVDHTSVQLVSWVANDPAWDCDSEGALPAGSSEGVNVHLTPPVGDTVTATWPTPLNVFPGAKAGTTSCLVLFQSGVGGASRHTQLSLTGFWT